MPIFLSVSKKITDIAYGEIIHFNRRPYSNANSIEGTKCIIAKIISNRIYTFGDNGFQSRIKCLYQNEEDFFHFDIHNEGPFYFSQAILPDISEYYRIDSVLQLRSIGFIL